MSVKHMGKRVLAALLCIVVVITTNQSSLLSLTALAATDTLPQIVVGEGETKTTETLTETPAETPSETPAEASEEEPTEAPIIKIDETDEELQQTVSDNSTPDTAFEQSQESDGIRIHVTADAGVFPEGATLAVKKIEQESKQEKIEDTINDELTGTKTVQQSYAFDITIKDAEGNEIQPDTNKGGVHVTFENIDTTEAENRDKSTGIEVFHVEDNLKSADAVEVVTAENDTVEFAAEHFSIYVVVVIGNDKVKDYALSEKKDVTDILDDLGINYTSVTGVVSSKQTVVETSTEVENGENVYYVKPIANGTATVTVTADGGEIPIQMTVKNGVYLNGSTGSDSNSGNKPNADAGSDGPVKTTEQAATKLGEDGGIVYVVGNGEIINADTTFDFSGKSITMKRETASGFSGVFYTITSDKTLSLLSDINFETENKDADGNDEDRNLINIQARGTLVLGGGITLQDRNGGSILALEAATAEQLNPIELQAVPDKGTKYLLSFNTGIADGTVLVHTNGLEDVFKYFGLKSELVENYELVLNTDGDIILSEKVVYGDKIFLDGVNGNDNNSGAVAARAVKTFERARALCEEQDIATVVICGTVTVDSSATWEKGTKTNSSQLTIKPVENFDGSMIRVIGGTLTLKLKEVRSNISEHTITIVECAGGQISLDNDMTMKVVERGIGVKATSGSLTMMSGNIQVDSGIGVQAEGSSFTMSGGTIAVNSAAAKGINIASNASCYLKAGITKLGADSAGSTFIALENAGNLYLQNDLADTVLSGVIQLKEGKPIYVSEVPTGEYKLKLSGFQDGDTVVAGGGITSEAYKNQYSLLETVASESLEWDAKNKNVIYRNSTQTAVYLDPINGNDSNSGATAKTPVQTLTDALTIIAGNEEILTMYVMNPVDVTSATTIQPAEGVLSALQIYPYKNMNYIFKLSNTLNLKHVNIHNTYSSEGAIYHASGVWVDGSSAVLNTNNATTVDQVIVKDGLLEVGAGQINNLRIQNKSTTDTTNGSVIINSLSKLPNGILINAVPDIVGGGKFKVPLQLGGTLEDTNHFTIEFINAENWIGREVVKAKEDSGAVCYAERFTVPTGKELELGSGESETTTSLYLRDVSGNYIYLNGRTGDDSKDGSTVDNAVKTFGRAYELAKEENPKKDIVICGTVSISGEETWGKEVVEEGWTPTVYRYTDTSKFSSDSSMIYVGGSGKLTLQNIIIDGKYVSATRPGIRNDGNLILESGAVVQHCVNNYSAYNYNVFHGVINTNGSFTMKEGAVVQYNSAKFGGGVYVNEGTATISGGKISGNTATSYGGGVFVYSGTAIISGGEISGNTANYGGGVYVLFDTAIVTISGGKISGNTAKTFGGGVYVQSGTTTISGGEISGNTANYGGGVYVQSGTAAIGGGEIRGNTATFFGGGVYVDLGTAAISGGEISENTARTNGGGVYVQSGTATISGGEIRGNTATSFGGGVLVNEGTAIISGGEISGNTATSYGGGVYVQLNTAIVTISGGEISENTAAQGGGVFVYKGTTTISGGKISGNIASTYGGGVCVDDSTAIATIKGGEISGNTAPKGGGVFVNEGTAIISGGEISGNTAAISGNGVYVDSGWVVLQGSGGCVKDLIYQNNTSQAQIKVSAALTDRNHVYKIQKKGDVIGELVIPDGTVTDASQYIGFFEYVKEDATHAVSMEKKGNAIVLAKAIYVNGQTGDDSAVGAGESPANPRKTLPTTLVEKTNYYICGQLDITGTTTITGTDTSGVFRYTGFAVKGTPYTSYYGDLFNVAAGGSLTLSNVNLYGKRYSTESFNATGYLVRNNGTFAISGGTTLQDNKKGCIYLANGKTITDTTDVDTPGTQTGRVTVDMENPTANAVVVEGASSNTNISKFGLVPRLASTKSLAESENDLIIAGAKVIYLDVANAHGGLDTNDGLSPQTPVATLNKAREILDVSGGTIYVMSQITITGEPSPAMNQDNITYIRYAKVNSSDPESYTGVLFDITGGTLTLTDTVIDGNASKVTATGTLVTVAEDATFAVAGSTTLQNNTVKIIDQSGTMTMTGTPTFDGTVYLAADKTIAAVNPLTLSTDTPLTIEVADPPTTAEAPRTLIINTVMSTDFVALSQDGYGLKQQSVTIGSNPTECIVMTLGGTATTIYVNGVSGDDAKDGTTPANAVGSLTKAYDLLKTTGGNIVICGKISIANTTILDGSYVTAGGTTVTMDSGKSVNIRRYAKPTANGDWMDSYTGALFEITSGGKLAASNITIDGHQKVSASEPAVTAEAPMIQVKSGGQLIGYSGLTLQNNNNSSTSIYGGAVSNSGTTKFTGVTIKNCSATKGSSIYQNGALYVINGNSFGTQDVFLNIGKYVTITGSQDTPMVVTPASTAVPVRIATVSYGTKTGADEISLFNLSSSFGDYELEASGQDIYMVKNLLQSTITLNNKTVWYDGSRISIDQADKTGSTGAITYTYYTDSACTKKTTTEEAKGSAVFAGGAPKEAGTYYVKATVAADSTYAAATSNTAVLTINKVNITLDKNCTDGSVTNGSAKAAMNGGISNFTAVSDTRTGYKVTGYMIAMASGSTQVMNADGTLIAGVTNYTDANGKWIKEQTNVTLYAKWAECEASVTPNGGTATQYLTLEEAITAAKNSSGSTLTLLRNLSKTGTIQFVNNASHNYKLDLNGFTLSNTADFQALNGTLEILSSSNGGTLTSSGANTLQMNQDGGNAKVTLTSGSIICTATDKSAILMNAGYTLYINGGVIGATNSEAIYCGGVCKISGTAQIQNDGDGADKATIVLGTGGKLYVSGNPTLTDGYGSGYPTHNGVVIASDKGSVYGNNDTEPLSYYNGISPIVVATGWSNQATGDVVVNGALEGKFLPFNYSTASYEESLVTTGIYNVKLLDFDSSVTVKKNGEAYTGLTDVELYQSGSSKYTLTENGNTGVYHKAELPRIAQGTYDIYIGGSDTQIDLVVSNSNHTAEVNYYTVTYDANVPSGKTKTGAVPSSTSAYLDGANVNAANPINPNSLAVANYRLLGWAATSGATTPQTSLTISSTNRTFYAVWQAKTVPTVTDFTTPSDKEYNATSQTQNISVKDGVTGMGSVTKISYVGTGTTIYTESETAPTNVGTYKVTIDVAEGTDFASINGLSVGTYQITRKEVTITGITANNKTYDGTTAATVDATSTVFTGKVTVDTLGVQIKASAAASDKPAFANATAGNTKNVSWSLNALELTGASARNYSIKSDSQINTTANIAQKVLTAAYAGENIVVNGTPVGTVNVTGFVTGENASNAAGYTAPTVDFTGIDMTQTDTHSLTPVGGAATNYSFTYAAGNLVIAEATYTSTISPSTKDFGSITAGGTLPNAQIFTITNTGNMPLTFTEPESTTANSHYQIGTLSATTIQPAASATFTVQPKSGLTAGTYTETIKATVAGHSSADVQTSVSFKVNAASGGENNGGGNNDGGDNGGGDNGGGSTPAPQVNPTVAPTIAPAPIIQGSQQEKKDFMSKQAVVIKDQGQIIVTIDEDIPEEEKVTAAFPDTRNIIDACLSTEEEKQVSDGAKIEIRMTVKKLIENIPVKEQTLIEESVQKLSQEENYQGLTIGNYVDIFLEKRINGSAWEKLVKLNGEAEVTIEIPEELRGLGESYYVIGSDGATVDLMEDLDDDPDCITFMTKIYNTYAIAYRAAAAGSGEVVVNELTRSDETEISDTQANKCWLCGFCPCPLNVCIFIWIAIAILIILLIVWLIRKKKKKMGRSL